jgi:hypothetical protein
MMGISIGALHGVNLTEDRIIIRTSIQSNKDNKDNIYSKAPCKLRNGSNSKKELKSSVMKPMTILNYFSALICSPRNFLYPFNLLIVQDTADNKRKQQAQRSRLFLKKKTALPLIFRSRILAVRQMNWQQFYPK